MLASDDDWTDRVNPFETQQSLVDGGINANSIRFERIRLAIILIVWTGKSVSSGLFLGQR